MSRICQGCGGVLGRDCFNERECIYISQQQEQEEYYKQQRQAYEEFHQQPYEEPPPQTCNDNDLPF